eukprot:SAG31_NODE_24106_length_489_cov_0.684615_1_plen_103_part_10
MIPNRSGVPVLQFGTTQGASLNSLGCILGADALARTRGLRDRQRARWSRRTVAIAGRIGAAASFAALARARTVRQWLLLHALTCAALPVGAGLDASAAEFNDA